MKIVNEKRSVATAGMQGQREFTVKVGAHIMAVLSGLYQNPIDAIVREYSTNMYDAWLALKRSDAKAVYQKPIVELPTVLSPVLVFKDFGIGMSFNTVWEVYSQYGNSTKGDSNDEVGGFGLGSKTAFCYNNGQQWTIESRYNGELMTFMAFVGEDGIPNITHVMTVPTNERNGVTIRIPIRRNDIQSVHAAAHKYLPFFPMELTVVNNDAPIAAPDYLLSGGNGDTAWGMARSRTTYNYAVTAVMGNVPYPVQFNHGSELLSGVPALDGGNFTIHMPIGSLDIVPSRDGLKYTDRTVKALNTRLKQVVRVELAKAIQDQLSNCKTEYDFLVGAEKYRNVPCLKALSTFMFNGKTLDFDKGIVRTLADLHKLDKSATMETLGLVNGGGATPAVMPSAVHPNYEHWLVMRDDVLTGSVGIQKGYINTKFVSRTVKGRAAKYGHKYGRITLVRTKLTDAQLCEFFGGMPADRLISASAWSGKVTVPRGPKGNDALYRYNGSSWDARVNVPDGKKKMFYLPLTQDEHTKRWKSAEIQPSKVRDLTDLARKLGVMQSDDSLYGIKKDEIKDFDAKVWVELGAAVHAAIASYIVTESAKLSLYRFRAESYGTSTAAHVGSVLTHFGMNSESRFKNFVKLTKKLDESYESSTQTVQQIYKIATMTNARATRGHSYYDDDVSALFGGRKLTFTLPAADVSVENEATELVKTYPMLAVLTVDRYYHSTQKTAVSKRTIIEYMDMMDAMRKSGTKV